MPVVKITSNTSDFKDWQLSQTSLYRFKDSVILAAEIDENWLKKSEQAKVKLIK